MQIAEIDDHGCIAVDDIFARSLAITAAWHLREWIVRSNRPILCHPTGRTPAAAQETCREGRIECTTVNAGLTARDDLRERHDFRGPTNPATVQSSKGSGRCADR